MATYRWLTLCAALGITVLEVGLFAAASSVTPGVATPTAAAVPEQAGVAARVADRASTAVRPARATAAPRRSLAGFHH